MGTVTIKEPYEQNLEDTFRKYGFKTFFDGFFFAS